MKETTYEFTLPAIDTHDAIQYSVEITTSDTPQEAFKRTLAKGCATSVTLTIPFAIINYSEGLSWDDVYEYVNTLLVRAMLITGIVYKIETTGDIAKGYCSGGVGLDIYVNTPTHVGFIINECNDEPTIWAIGARGYMQRPTRIDKVYDLTKHEESEWPALPKVEHKDYSYDSLEPFRKLDDDQLQYTAYENQRILDKSGFWDMTWPEIEALHSVDPNRVVQLFEYTSEQNYCNTVIAERKQVVFDYFFAYST